MMRTSLDVALGKPNPPREVQVLAGKLEEGLDQAEKLLDNLLVLARSQRGLTSGSPRLVPGAGRWPTDGHSGAGNGAKTSGGSAEARRTGAGP
jgi:hypothetical protein